MYAGRVDGIQLRTDDMLDLLDSLETEVRRQSEMMRQILTRLPPPPGDGTAGPSFLTPSSPLPPF